MSIMFTLYLECKISILIFNKIIYLIDWYVYWFLNILLGDYLFEDVEPETLDWVVLDCLLLGGGQDLVDFGGGDWQGLLFCFLVLV